MLSSEQVKDNWIQTGAGLKLRCLPSVPLVVDSAWKQKQVFGFGTRLDGTTSVHVCLTGSI